MAIGEISESELKLFIDSIINYFKKTTNNEPKITSAYLGTQDITGFEFNGIVNFSGSYNGQIIVSMTREILHSLLIIQEEKNLSDNNLLDITGEIANTLAGNARKTLSSGFDLNISVPTKVKGYKIIKSKTRQHPYIITLSWLNFSAMVCVDINHLHI